MIGSEATLGVTSGVAADIDRHRQSGDVCRTGLYVDVKGRRVTSHPGRTDAEGIDPAEELLLDSSEVGLGVAIAYGAE